RHHDLRPIFSSRHGPYVTMLVMRLQLARLFLPLLLFCGAGIAAAGLAAAPTSTAAAPIAADLFDDIYAKSQPIDATIKTIDAGFTETTTSPLLVKPLVAEGTLHGVRPLDVEMAYTKPERKNVTIKGGQLLFTWPDRKLKDERDISQALGRIQKYFV